MYHPNPSRKCGGTKTPDAYYLEGGEMSEDGALHNWSWLLGDGLERYIHFSDREVPPRQIVGVDPVMTIMTMGYITAGGPPIPVSPGFEEEYERLLMATKRVGVADHVGDSYYSAWNFYLETALYGPSRRVSKEVAESLGRLIGKHGPLPMIFAHTQIPVFRDKAECVQAKLHVKAIHGTEFGSRYHGPTWENHHWGMYARRDHWTGSSHYLIPILGVIDDLKENWQDYKHLDEWKDARKFFKGLRYVKQTFGCAWLCRVSYTLPFEGPADEDAYEIPGINVINLEEVGEFYESPEETPVGVD